MHVFPLHLESGPKHRRTMAHLLDLPGCVIAAPTTDDAVAVAPAVAAAYLQFLRRHGDDVDLDATIETPVELHVIARGRIGYGDPAEGFPADFLPIDQGTVDRTRERHRWMHEDIVALASESPMDDLLSGEKWATRRVLEHVAEVEYEYIRCSLGHMDGVRQEVRALIAMGDPVAALNRMQEAVDTRLGSVTAAELEARVQRGEKTWTVARTCRRLLEHRWEHLTQLTGAASG